MPTKVYVQVGERMSAVNFRDPVVMMTDAVKLAVTKDHFELPAYPVYRINNSEGEPVKKHLAMVTDNDTIIISDK